MVPLGVVPAATSSDSLSRSSEKRPPRWALTKAKRVPGRSRPLEVYFGKRLPAEGRGVSARQPIGERARGSGAGPRGAAAAAGWVRASRRSSPVRAGSAMAPARASLLLPPLLLLAAARAAGVAGALAPGSAGESLWEPWGRAVRSGRAGAPRWRGAGGPGGTRDPRDPAPGPRPRGAWGVQLGRGGLGPSHRSRSFSRPCANPGSRPVLFASLSAKGRAPSAETPVAGFGAR